MSHSTDSLTRAEPRTSELESRLSAMLRASKVTPFRAAVYLEWIVALLIACGVTSFWRGSWVMLDAWLYPEPVSYTHLTLPTILLV